MCSDDIISIISLSEINVVCIFRGGKICLTEHFKPLWARNVPKFGIGHAMALGASTGLGQL